MSKKEIMAELPKLSLATRRAICKKIIELEEDQEVLETASCSALQGFRMLDEMEKKNDKRRSHR